MLDTNISEIGTKVTEKTMVLEDKALKSSFIPKHNSQTLEKKKTF